MLFFYFYLKYIYTIVILTRDDHHAYRKDFLVVSLRCDVSESDASHTRHGEVQRGNVHGLPWWPVNQFGGICMVRHYVRVRILRDVGQFPQPRILVPVLGVGPS